MRSQGLTTDAERLISGQLPPAGITDLCSVAPEC
jgi:hypothetical protein